MKIQKRYKTFIAYSRDWGFGFGQPLLKNRKTFNDVTLEPYKIDSFGDQVYKLVGKRGGHLGFVCYHSHYKKWIWSTSVWLV